jgi:carotenoid 1,2-hydratase
VFSPYYAWRRRSGPTEPIGHCAMNVALYDRRHGRWAMTERGAAQVHREPQALCIGASSMRWSGDALQISVDEICAPLPRRIRGSIRLVPHVVCGEHFALDLHGLHHWTPYAPLARVEVDLQAPDMKWSGSGYFDSNCGDVPLETTFKDWTWSRTSMPDKSIVLYDVNPRDAHARGLALSFSSDGASRPIDAPAEFELPGTRWQLGRTTRVDRGQRARVVETLEDAPFYSRSLLDTHLLGSHTPAIHESLSLDRFRSPWVQCMLPFRMPRVPFR